MKDMVAWRAGDGTREKGGGAKLSRKPEEYTLDEILEIRGRTAGPRGLPRRGKK